MKLSPILHSQAGWGIFLLYCHPHLTGNDKGLYATMNRWRIDPFCIYQLCGYLIYYNEKTSFKEVFEKSLAIPDYFHYLCN